MQLSGGRRRADRGAAAVETALLLPLLLMVVFAMIDFGRMLNTQIRVTEAAREGARALTLVDATAARSIAADVMGTAPSSRIGEAGAWTGSPKKNCAAGENQASYEVVYGFEFITPLGAFTGMVTDRLTLLNAKAVMPCRA